MPSSHKHVRAVTQTPPLSGHPRIGQGHLRWRFMVGRLGSVWLDPLEAKGTLYKQHQLLWSCAGSTTNRGSVCADAKLVGMPLAAFLRMCGDVCQEVVERQARAQVADRAVDGANKGHAQTKALMRNAGMSRSRQQPWWRRRSKEGEKREQLQAALRALSESQLASLAAGVAMELQRRIPRLGCSVGGALTDKAKNNSTEVLLRHKDLGRWVGAGL
ncbi:hypothetical protein LTR53_011622 [Teratosphaeriaceae sp. CCFEE 6253]|nr:hypothetical protein LTR53_011622 [Teratosphaeriaceae sp. CCFEE 6253]